MEEFLKSGFFESLLGYNNVDWYVNEVEKLENKMSFYFKKTKKDISMTEQDEKHYRKTNNCQSCERNIESDKVGNHCHLTSKNRGPAHRKCNTDVTQEQSNFIPFLFHSFSNYDCHLIFKS